LAAAQAAQQAQGAVQHQAQLQPLPPSFRKLACSVDKGQQVAAVVGVVRELTKCTTRVWRMALEGKSSIVATLLVDASNARPLFEWWVASDGVLSERLYLPRPPCERCWAREMQHACHAF
jgi:hypothetical protein